MTLEQQSQMNLPHHPRVPPEVYQAVTEERLFAGLSRVKQTGEDNKKLAEVIYRHRDQVVHLLGADKYQMLRGYMKDQKKFKERLFFPPRGPQMTSKLSRS